MLFQLYHPVLLPRNTRQVINLQHNEHQQSRLSHDALYNLHELSLDLSGFVKVISVCGLDVILEEMEMVLCTQSTNSQLLFIWHYSPVRRFLCITFPHPFQDISSHFSSFSYTWEKVSSMSWRTNATSIESSSSTISKHPSVPLVTDDEVGVHKVSSNCT